MSYFRQTRRRLAFFSAWGILIFSAAAQGITNSSDVPKAPSQLLSFPAALMPPPLPPLAPASSPIDFFRKLLVVSPQERQKMLADKSPEIRKRILAKVKEYAALDPDERELRLRTTELRWYLIPLLRASPTNQAARLAAVPDDIRDVVKSRLMLWQILPPPMQQEFLENERTLGYFSRVDIRNELSGGPEPDAAAQPRWNALSETERQAVAEQFNQFFELSPEEKQQALGALSDAERRQMERTLKAFDKLPAPQRKQCIRAFEKFAGMSPAERAEFLKNARRWSQMSVADRKAWCDLVANVPLWPPLPPIEMAPPPPPMPKMMKTAAVTNHS